MPSSDLAEGNNEAEGLLGEPGETGDPENLVSRLEDPGALWML